MAKAPRGGGVPPGGMRRLHPAPAPRSRRVLGGLGRAGGGRPRSGSGFPGRGPGPARTPPGLHTEAGAIPNTGGEGRRIESPPIEQYWRRLATEIPGAARSATVPASGTVTVSVGPQGLGNRWYVTQVNVQTTTGAADASTAAVYVGAGALAVSANLVASSYAGGQDTLGVNARSIQPGEFVTVVWSGANPGDTATVVAYGEQQALTNWG